MKFPFPGVLALAFCLSAAPAASRAQTAARPSAPGADDACRVQAAAYVDSHIVGKNPGPDRPLFSAGNGNTGTGWVRNQKLWCADLDLTCFSPWNSTEHNLQGGTLITRRHVLLANHFSNQWTGTPPMVPGITTIQFVGRDNVTHTRTITRLTQVKNTDVLIGTLDKDLPDTVTPAQLFPTDQGHAVPPGTPVIYTGQDKCALVGECATGAGSFFNLQAAAAPGRAPWTGPGLARVGDSGSPIFLPWHGRAVLLCHFFYPNGGPSTGYYTAAINAITGPDYPVTEASLAPVDGPAKPDRAAARH